MCGIVGFLDKRAGSGHPTGRTVMAMLQALACRGPDSAGVALVGDPDEPAWHGEGSGHRPDWFVRFAPADPAAVARLTDLGIGRVEGVEGSAGDGTLRFRFAPDPGVTPADVEMALGAARGGWKY